MHCCAGRRVGEGKAPQRRESATPAGLCQWATLRASAARLLSTGRGASPRRTDPAAPGKSRQCFGSRSSRERRSKRPPKKQGRCSGSRCLACKTRCRPAGAPHRAEAWWPTASARRLPREPRPAWWCRRPAPRTPHTRRGARPRRARRPRPSPDRGGSGRSGPGSRRGTSRYEWITRRPAPRQPYNPK